MNTKEVILVLALFWTVSVPHMHDGKQEESPDLLQS